MRLNFDLAAALRVFLVLFALLIFAGCFSGCNGLRPQVNAGYYIENLPDSKTTVLIGTNNSQANAIHAAIGDAAGAADGEKAEADKAQQTAKSSGLFVNNNVGDRAADIDATSALEMLKDVRGTSAGQGQTTTKGNESPATGGAQTQTPTQTESRTVNTPVAVSQQGAVAQTGATPAAGEQAIPAVFSLGIKQAQPVTATQKSAVDSAVAADTSDTVPAGLDMSLADWKTLKAAYLECPECLSLTDAELAALKAATGK
ncbi:MAG: hypothetical protein WCQ61_07460 [Proteiniphilum sp.]